MTKEERAVEGERNRDKLAVRVVAIERERERHGDEQIVMKMESEMEGVREEERV